MEISCSGCGRRYKPQVSKFGCNFSRLAERATTVGWRTYNGTPYCPKCSQTWESRNGKDKPMDSTWATIIAIMNDWCQDMHNEIKWYKDEMAGKEHDY